MKLLRRYIRGLKRRCIYAWQNIAGTYLLNRLLKRHAGEARIVTYHGICIKQHTKFNGIFLKNSTFESHLKFYQKNFNVISLDDYYKGNFHPLKFNICVTFDDGFSNNHKYVLPLLKKYQIPAAFFITAIREAGGNILWNDYLGIFSKYGPKKLMYENVLFDKNKQGRYISAINGANLPEIIRSGAYDLKTEMIKTLSLIYDPRQNIQEEDFWLQMDETQIKELASSTYCTIGTHGYYHNDLAKIPLEKAAKEMIDSKRYLEKITGSTITAIAFPYGTYTNDVVEEAKKAGYTQLLALHYHYPENYTDNMMRERLIVNPYISVINQMHATIKGRYE